MGDKIRQLAKNLISTHDVLMKNLARSNTARCHAPPPPKKRRVEHKFAVIFSTFVSKIWCDPELGTSPDGTQDTTQWVLIKITGADEGREAGGDEVHYNGHWWFSQPISEILRVFPPLDSPLEKNFACGGHSLLASPPSPTSPLTLMTLKKIINDNGRIPFAVGVQ